jgi:hypothetical protein
MRKPKAYLLSGIIIAGVGLLISLVATGQLLTWLMVQSIVSSTFWHMPLALLIISGLCIMASIALMIVALTSQAKR